MLAVTHQEAVCLTEDYGTMITESKVFGQEKAKWIGTGVENSSYRVKQMDQASSSQKLLH